MSQKFDLIVIGGGSAGFAAAIKASEHGFTAADVLGPLAPEIIHQATLAVKHGMTLEEIAGMIHVYPTMSEALKLVAQSFSRDVSRLSCCAE